MKKLFSLLFYLLFVFMVVGSASASVLINEDFEGPGASFVDDTNGTLQYESLNGSVYSTFKSDPNSWASSLIFSNIVIDSETDVLSFEYKFEENLNAGINRGDVNFGSADYFRVSLLALDALGTPFADLEVFRHALGNEVDSPIIESAFDNWSTKTNSEDPAILPGFTLVELFMQPVLDGVDMIGTTFDVYVEISNGYAELLNGDPVDYADFNTTASVDNVFLGQPAASPVPEPTVFALFGFGMWFLSKRARTRLTK